MSNNTSVYFKQGGDELVVADGGTITIEAGGTLSGAGTITVPDGSITKAKTAMFISVNTTGDGMDQDIAHGLGVDPTTANVFVSVLDTLTNTVGDFTCTIDSTDDTNVTMNVTAGVIYRVMAWAP